MDRISYQNLRFEVETQLQLLASDSGSDHQTCINSIMRIFLAAMSAQEVKRQRSRRDLVTFRRDNKVKVPSWAFKSPALDTGFAAPRA